MNTASIRPNVNNHLRILSWPRVRPVLIACFVFSLVFRLFWWQALYLIVLSRILLVGFVCLLSFGLAESWPARLPKWMSRWALQVLAVAFVVPFAAFGAYSLTTLNLASSWWHDNDYLSGFASLSVLGLLIAPWIAIAALLRQIRGEAERQAMAFDLERSRFERQALEARLRLLQAQVEPHFLFNTLANIRELVDSGSPQASNVLASLIAYLRAAMPRLHESTATLAQELDLVRAYLAVMLMRMPDRLQFTLHADEEALELFCPPMSLLTLVENAVRHGVDPAERGGRIDVIVRLRNSRCHASVVDTGVGLVPTNNGAGTGLVNLRERLQLAFQGDAGVHLTAVLPHGASAELDFPARRSTP